mmetsp:Transcript_36410/g.27005  ORF Transcript_36410/g.27005 Transcript_36410/m.27005 type:complete len:268 (-) Transcript_36410:26-829(-)
MIHLHLISAKRSSYTTSSAGRDLTRLGTSRHVSSDSTWLTHVLLVTTTMRVINRVHGNTTNLWPLVSLNSVLVESTTCFQDWLVSSSTTGNQTDHGSASIGDCLLATRRKSNTSGAFVSILGNDQGVITRGTSHNTVVTNFSFNVANNCTFRDLAKRKNIANSQFSLLSSENELATVKTFRSADQSINSLESVSILELNTGNWGTSPRVMEDFLDNTFNVSVSFGIVLSLVGDSTLATNSVGLVDRSLSLTTRSNYLSHFDSIEGYI